MQVYYDIKDFRKLDNAVVTTGTFDGVHYGHQKILKRLKELSSASGGESVVITYWPHPRKVLSDGLISPKILYTLEERIQLLGEYDIDHLLIINFTKEFSNLSCDEYLKTILENAIGTKKLIIGYDHHFGKNREGNFEYLVANAEKYGFEVEDISREDIDSIAVSSSNIRAALAAGDLETANLYLGKPFFMIGQVVRGNQMGRKIGFPTANIKMSDPDKIIPGDGVYAVKVKEDNGTFNGMLNIGFRPTINGQTRTVEVNIFNFDKDIYDKQIEVEFICRLRKEEKFSGLEALKNQLAADKLKALEILS